jgi:hypothetical protein
MKKYFYTFILAAIFFSCEKIDLPRDNPLDNNSNSGSPNIKFSKYLIVYDGNNSLNPSLNGNGVINRTESIKLKVYLKNEGTKKAGKVKATITCTNSYITNLSPTGSIPFSSHSLTADDFIPINDERYGYSGSSPVEYTIGFDVPYGAFSGATATFTLNITDETSTQWTDSFTITIY